MSEKIKQSNSGESGASAWDDFGSFSAWSDRIFDQAVAEDAANRQKRAAAQEILTQRKTKRINEKIDKTITNAAWAETLKARRAKMAAEDKFSPADLEEEIAYQEALRASLEKNEASGEFDGERNVRVDKDGVEHVRTYNNFDIYPNKYGPSGNDRYSAESKRRKELSAIAAEMPREENETTAEHYARVMAALEERNRAGESELERAVGQEQERLGAEERERLAAEERERLAAEERERLAAEERARQEAEAGEQEAEQEGEGMRLAGDTEDVEQEAEQEGDTSPESEAPKNPEDMTDEELEEERRKNQARLDELDEKYALVAINADFTHDKKELAHDLAEQDLNEELSQSGILKRLWKGTLFKKYYEKKYEQEYLDGDRDRDGKTVYDLVYERSEGAMERFVLGAVEDMSYVHEKAGEKLTEADSATTEKVRAAIERYATAGLGDGLTEEQLRLQFEEEIGRIEAESEAGDGNKDLHRRMINNYLKVAEQARRAVDHNISIERVMEGFRVYNAEARDSVRTDVHRDNIDKIVNKLEGSVVGAIVPAQIIAGAVGIASAFTQTGARAVAGVAGGLLVSSALSGLKERNRVTEDRARMMRDVANGLEYGAKNGQSKYEARIGGTLYDLQKASDLTANIEAAMAMEDSAERDEALLSAMTEARVRIDFSDAERKDLISYSSEDSRGTERLKLDQVLIRAERRLTEAGVARFNGMKEHLQAEISDSVDETDQDFRRTRTALAVKKAGKTLAIGAATFFVSQEIMAAFDPGKIGILEKAGILKTDNADTASETLIASGFRLNGTDQVVTETHTTDPIRVSGDKEITIEQLEEAGYTRTEVQAAWTSQETGLVEVDPSASDAALRVKYDGWANNGTRISDGNELSAHISDGQFVSTMRGNSTLNGEVLNYESLADAGKIKGYLTIDGAKFEIASSVNDAGQLTWGENGIFTTTTGETIRAIGEDGEKLYKYFEIAMDNGVDAEGIQHIVPLATDVGRDTFEGTLQQVVTTTVEHPAVYEFVKTTETVKNITRGVTTAGVFAPETARNGLGAARARMTEQAPTPPAEAEPSPADEEIIDVYTTDETAAGQAASNGEAPQNPPEFSEGEQDFLRMIEDSRARFGNEGVDILTDTSPYNEENDSRYGAWWDTLTRENKDRVLRLVDALDDAGNNIAFGQGFRTWYNSLNNQ